MLHLIIESFTRPRETMRGILRRDLPEALLLPAAVAICCVVAAVEGAFAVVFGTGSDGSLLRGPIGLAVVQFGILLVSALLIDRVGAMFGGTGNWKSAMIVAIWYMVVSLGPNMIVLYVQHSGEDMSTFLAVQFIAAGWMLVVLTGFVQVVHGFKSAFLTGLGVLATGFFFGLLVLLALSALGILPPGAESNV